MAKAQYNADSITVLEGLEAVRKRPGMYIGGVGTKGLNHLIYEIVDNAVDEHLAGFCTEITVTLEADGSCTVKDNGRGIPVEMHKKGVSAERVVLSTLHAGGKFDNNSYKTSGGLHGVGSSVVNALSDRMKVKISRDGKVYYDEYEKGHPVIELKDGLLPVIGKSKETGTEINFLPDPTIFEKTKFKAEWLKSRLHESAYLNPNLALHYVNKRAGEEEMITYHEPDGIIAYVRELNNGKEPVHEPVYFKGSVDQIEVEVAFQFVDAFEENILGFCNNIFTQEGGTHLVGFKTKFTQLINSYARELGILKEKDSNFTGADGRCGGETPGSDLRGTDKDKACQRRCDKGCVHHDWRRAGKVFRPKSRHLKGNHRLCGEIRKDPQGGGEGEDKYALQVEVLLRQQRKACKL